jgi:hypothetical protein
MCISGIATTEKHGLPRLWVKPWPDPDPDQTLEIDDCLRKFPLVSENAEKKIEHGFTNDKFPIRHHKQLMKGEPERLLPTNGQWQALT